MEKYILEKEKSVEKMKIIRNKYKLRRIREERSKGSIAKIRYGKLFVNGKEWKVDDVTRE